MKTNKIVANIISNLVEGLIRIEMDNKLLRKQKKQLKQELECLKVELKIYKENRG